MFAFFRRPPLRQSVERFYVELAGSARNPDFFTICNVPDTFEGRFEILILHVAFVQLRLKQFVGNADKAAQFLTDCLFSDMDAAIREAGVSDVGVPRKMKMLAEAYFGRLAAYEAALRGERDMAQAMARNVLALADGAPGHPDATRLANYCTELTTMLAGRDCTAILALRRKEIQALTDVWAARIDNRA